MATSTSSPPSSPIPAGDHLGAAKASSPPPTPTANVGGAPASSSTFLASNSTPPQLRERNRTSSFDSSTANQPAHFDLSGSLYKRRGGLGWNADQNWILRWFTLHGSILCYYDSADLENADPSRPRGRINLAKEETVVDMHLSNKAGSQTQFRLTINIYGTVGGKRKWEMCCKTKSQQMEWFEALRKYDGKPLYLEHSVSGGSVDGATFSSPKKKKRNRTTGSLVYEETSPFALRSRTTSDTSEIEESRKGGLGGASDLLRSLLDSTISTHIVVSFVALNAGAYLMRVGSELTFWLGLIVVNLVVLSSLSSSGSVRQKATSAQSIPAVDSEEELPFVSVLQAGSTMPRSTPTKESLVETITEHGIESAGAIRACAAAMGREDYMPVPHSFWNVDAALFNLRVGPNYKKNKEKAPSGPALYDLYAVDLVRGKSRLKHASDGFNMPQIKGITDMETTGHPDVPPMIVVNTSLPTEEPSLMGKEDGSSCIAVIYLVISQRTLDELKDFDTASPAVKLLAAWCKQSSTNAEFRGRFKAMCVLDDIETLGLPPFIAGYNGKPTLINKSGTFARYPKYIEMSINVHLFAFVAKKCLFSLQSKFPSLVLNVGFTIEGRDDDELPEVLLGGCRIVKLDLSKVYIPGNQGSNVASRSY